MTNPLLTTMPHHLIKSKNLPIDVLRSFVTVIELGGFSYAAEQLSRSQPAISLQIKRLEERLDQTLFARNGQKTALTPAGEVLFDYAKRILALNDEVTARFGGTQISGRLRLGIPSEFATALLPQIIKQFTQAHPNVTLEVNCDLSKHLLIDVNKNQYDLILALHNSPDDYNNQIEKINIKNDELVWVCSHDHDINHHKTLPLIVAPEGCIYRKRGIQRLKSYGLSWRIVYTIPDLPGIQAALEEDLGITVLAKSTVPKNLKIIRHSNHFPRLGNVAISLVSRNRSQAVEKLSGYLKASIN